MTKSRWIGLALGIMLIMAASGLVLWQGVTTNSAGAAFAQAAPTLTPGAPGKAPATQGAANNIVTAFWNALASKLGIGVDTVKSDFADAEKAAIEQAVQDGKLTRAQADRIEQRLSADGVRGPFPFLGGMRGMAGKPGPGKGLGFGWRGGLAGGANTLEAAAAALNMQPSDLTAQLRSGNTLADIAKAQNVDQGVVKQAIINAAKTQLQREVQDGVLTQAQADQILYRLTPDNIDLTRMRGFGWR